MKTTQVLMAVFVLLIGNSASAGLIANGDFQSCDFQHWQKDTDSLGDPGNTGDFSIDNDSGNCSAVINVDITNGATAFNANTLFTALDFTLDQGVFALSFDWEFSGADDETLFADSFFVGLSNNTGNLFDANGEHGYLIAPTSTYGSGSFSVVLDNSFNNQNNWLLDFSVQGGWNTTSSLTSKLMLDNVMLTPIATSVPEPTSLVMFISAIAGLFTQRRTLAL